MRARSFVLLVGAIMLAALALALGATSATTPAAAQEDAPERLEPEPMQASCGNRRCEPPEDCNSCPSDCGSCCGNNRCEPPEDCNSCPRDCGDCCGNRRCEPPEDCNSCPSDCGRC